MVTHDAQSAVRPQQQQQFALQTLPQHVRLAHDHALQLNSSSSSDEGDSDDDDSIDNDSGSDSASNQLDAHREPFRAATGVATRSLWQRVREQHEAAATADSKVVVTTIHGGEQQQQQEEHDDDALAAHLRQRHQPRQRQALERKNSARGSTDTAPYTLQLDASSNLSEATPLNQPQQRSDRAFTLSPLQPGAASIAHNGTDQPRRKPSTAAPITEAVIQNEIRTMIAQTEQLLSGAQQVFNDAQQQQQTRRSSLQPHPPQFVTLLTSSPLRSSRLTLSDIMSRTSAVQQEDASNNNRDDHHAEAVELMMPGESDGCGTHEGDGDSTEGEDGEEDSDSIFSDDSSSQSDDRLHELDELSDGEMHPSLSLRLLAEQQSMPQSPRYIALQQSQADDRFQSAAVRNRNDENGVEEEQDEDEDEQLSATTNRDINASKARALKESMVGNLMRLGFKENLTRLALDAGIQEIDHYDSDCELAYVDIFMSLVKMVCDAHLDSFSHRPPHHHHLGTATAAWMSSAESVFSLSGFASLNGGGSASHPASGSSHQTNSLPFKWPVFDMAQFEFGNARAGTCFDSVCVLTNLPKVSMDRTEELMEILSCNLFCMIGDPIQVVIPSASATGRTKGHAFLEFDDHHMAKACAAAIDGLTWGRGPFGRIRSSMFRQYQVKSPTAPQMRFDGLAPQNELSSSLSLGAQGALDVSTSSSTDPNDSVHTGFSRFDDEDQAISGGNSGGFSPPTGGGGGRLMTNPFPDDGSESGDVPFSPLFGSHRSLDPFPDDPFTNSEEDDDDDNDDDEDDMLWRGNERDVHLTYQDPRFAPRDVSIDDMVIRNYPFANSRQLSGGHGLFGASDSQLSSDAEGEDEGFGFGGGDHSDDTWGHNITLELQAAGDSCHFRREQAVRGFPMVLQARPQPFNGTSHGNAQSQSNATNGSCSGAKAQSPHPPRDLNAVLTDETEEETIQTDESEKPWRSYCEELIARNREMQGQVAYARRRIVQLGHNNQKLHLLIDRVERDRDGLMFENDLLQTQINGFEDHERHHEALMTELTILRKRLRKKERSLKGSQSSHSSGLCSTRSGDGHGFRQQEEEDNRHESASLDDVQFVLHHQLGANALSAKSVDELKDWEQLLESSLARVRSMKEAKAVALQKKLDRQVEEQQELKLCVICLSNEKSILCLPCRHLCLCESCSAREEVEKCPICRLHIDEMLLVYA